MGCDHPQVVIGLINRAGLLQKQVKASIFLSLYIYGLVCIVLLGFFFHNILVAQNRLLNNGAGLLQSQVRAVTGFLEFETPQTGTNICI